MNSRANAASNTTNYEQAQALRTKDFRRGGGRDTVIGFRQLLRCHANTGVGHGDHHGPIALHRAHDNGATRVREHRRVLKKLGEHVRRSQGGVTEHGRVRIEFKLNALVQLDLRGRGTDHVGQRHGSAQAAASVNSCKHEERLRVTAHSRREVIKCEQLGQRFGIILGSLHLVDGRELTVEEHLVATGDVNEHLGN